MIGLSQNTMQRQFCGKKTDLNTKAEVLETVYNNIVADKLGVEWCMQRQPKHITYVHNNNTHVDILSNNTNT